MAIADILAGGGVVAVVAAIVGGGLKGVGWDVPVLHTVKRQLLLAGAGILFILGAFYASAGEDLVAGPPQVQVAVGSAVDFRSSERSDGFRPGQNRGYLILAATVKVRNRSEQSATVTWEDTEATLITNGRKVPFRAYYFFTGSLDWQHWLGEKKDTAGPVKIGPGETQQRDVIFMPRNAGHGAYMWDDFLQNLLNGGADPELRVAARIEGGGVPEAPVAAACTARPSQFLLASRERARSDKKFQPSLTAPC